MAAKPKPKLTDKQWRKLAPKYKRAAANTAKSLKEMAGLCKETVNGAPHADWSWLLRDARNRCIDAGWDISYSVTYMVQLAETYEAVDGDLDRGVPVSVLVEGRNLDNLTDIIEDEEEKENLTVTRIRAHVYKDANDDDRPVEEVEEEIKAKRDEVKEKQTRQRHAEKIEGWSLDKSDKLLTTMRSEATAYRSALLRFQSEGTKFNLTDFALALDAVKQLASMMESMQSAKTKKKLKKAA